jgi:hypothetical protein
MTIPFEKLKARLLANRKVKAGYDALAPEFEIAAELVRARQRGAIAIRPCSPDGHQSVDYRPARTRACTSEYQDTPAICRSDRQQIPDPAFGGVTLHHQG